MKENKHKKQRKQNTKAALSLVEAILVSRGHAFIVRLYAVIEISLTPTGFAVAEFETRRMRGWQSQASKGLAVASTAGAPQDPVQNPLLLLAWPGWI